MTTAINRCFWVGSDPLYINYHDKEWGKPIHDDQKLFEAIILDGFQAGLSWLTILRKRENFRKAFDGFNAEKISRYTEKKIQKLMQDEGIIRNQLKIRAAVTNAKVFLKTKKEFGTFAKYTWQFTNHKIVVNKNKSRKDFKTSSPESDAMSRDMKKRGFKFCGTTICYAFMQAVGMINDHTMDCFCYSKK